jgi:hypothetical protein
MKRMRFHGWGIRLLLATAAVAVGMPLVSAAASVATPEAMVAAVGVQNMALLGSACSTPPSASFSGSTLTEVPIRARWWSETMGW